MMDLLNALKLSFRKSSSTAALKKQLLGFKHVASDKPYYQRGRGLHHLTGIRSFILCDEIWIRIKTLQMFVKSSFFNFLFLLQRGTLRNGPPGATNFWKTANKKNGKSLYLKIKMTPLKHGIFNEDLFMFWFSPVLVFTKNSMHLAEKTHQTYGKNLCFLNEN